LSIRDHLICSAEKADTDMTTIDIPALEQSAFDYVATDEEEKAYVESLATEVGSAGDWTARQTKLLELIETLDESAAATFDSLESGEMGDFLTGAEPSFGRMPASPTARDVPIDPEFDDAGDDVPTDSDELFAEMAPLYLGAILERLGEKSISCIEQAAFYFISAHPEHQQAASDWIGADPRHLQQFRKFLNANTSYKAAVERVLAMSDFDDEDPEE
jgi:hypothetical protein